MDENEFKQLMKEDSKKSRHVENGTVEINYTSWRDFDVRTIYAANSPHSLKSVFLGYAYRGDIPLNDKYVTESSVPYDVSLKACKEEVKLTILSYNEVVKRAKEIDWSKVKIER